MSILDYVDRELMVVEWDTLDGYQSYYPADGVLDENPDPLPLPDFKRYTPAEPMPFVIKPIKAGAVYRLVLNLPQGRPWEKVTEQLIYLQIADNLLGANFELGEPGPYAVSGHEGSPAGGEIEFSFVYQQVANDPSSLILIGHVRA